MAPLTIRAGRAYSASSPQTVNAVRAIANAQGRVPAVSASDGSGGTGVVGWLKTASNTGLAGKSLTTSDLTLYTGLSNWGGASPNITGTHTRRRFNLTTVLAPGSNTTFTECHFEVGNAGNMVIISGTNVTFNDCDFTFTGTGTIERCHIVAHPYYGAGNGLLVNGCKFSGGTIFINTTDVGSATVRDCYGANQDPDNNGGAQHRDGYTCRGTNGPILLERNRFICDQGATTGALFLQDTYGNGLTNLTFIENSFEGTGYNATLENSSALTFTNNRFRSYALNGGAGYGAATSTNCTFTSWTNNYRWSAAPPASYAQGTIVNQP